MRPGYWTSVYTEEELEENCRNYVKNSVIGKKIVKVVYGKGWERFYLETNPPSLESSFFIRHTDPSYIDIDESTGKELI